MNDGDNSEGQGEATMNRHRSHKPLWAIYKHFGYYFKQKLGGSIELREEL